MLSTTDYFTKIRGWHQASYLNNKIIRPDSAFYQRSGLDPLQQADLGLLLQTLLTSDESRIHLRCDEWQQSDELFSSFLATLCFYKYAQNQTETPVNELYKAGTVLYHPVSEQARVVVCRHETGVKTRPVKEETVRIKGVKHTQTKTYDPTFEQVAKYIPLANVAEHTYSRNALGNLADYFELFNKTLRQHRALTHFPRRLLVVAPHGTIQQLPAGSQFPIRYQFNRYYTVPVVCPLVEIVNRYDDARAELRKDGNTIDEVVILGDSGYRKSLNDLLNDLGDGYIKRVIILGGQPIQPEYGFRTWSWSTSERSWLRTQKLLEFTNISLPANGIKDLRPLFDEPVQQLRQLGLSETEAKAALNRLIGQYFRDAIVDAPRLLAYHREWLNDPTGVWAGWFAEAGEGARLPAFSATLLHGLEAVARYVTMHPAKLAQIEALVRPGVQTWVIARPRQAEALNAHFRHTPHIKAISFQELKKQLASPATRSEQFIFPALHLNYQPGGQLLRDYRLYRRALERAPGYVLHYEGLEEGIFRLCNWLYEREEHRCLTHPDRQHWVNFTYDPTQLPTPTLQASSGLLADLPPQEAETLDHLLDELDQLGDETPSERTRATAVLNDLNQSFARYFGVWKDIRKSRRMPETQPSVNEASDVPLSTGRPNDLNRYQLIFDNHTHYECSGTAWMARVVDQQITAVHPADLRVNDVIIHFAISFDNCREALLNIPEAKEAVAEIRWASKAWRHWLQKSIEIMAASKRCDETGARWLRHQKLTDLIKSLPNATEFVSYPTFERWLDKPRDYEFPRTIHHLQLILETHLNQFGEADRAAKVAEMHRIMNARGQSASFREVVTKVKAELAVYVITGKRGSILAKISEDHLKELLQTRSNRSVHSIQPI